MRLTRDNTFRFMDKAALKEVDENYIKVLIDRGQINCTDCVGLTKFVEDWLFLPQNLKFLVDDSFLLITILTFLLDRGRRINVGNTPRLKPLPIQEAPLGLTQVPRLVAEQFRHETTADVQMLPLFPDEDRPRHEVAVMFSESEYDPSVYGPSPPDVSYRRAVTSYFRVGTSPHGYLLQGQIALHRDMVFDMARELYDVVYREWFTRLGDLPRPMATARVYVWDWIEMDQDITRGSNILTIAVAM